MKWTKWGMIGLITLLLTAVGTMAFTEIETGWLKPQKEQTVDITYITDKVVVEYSDYGCPEKSFDTYVITKTNGVDGKKYIGIDLLSSTKRESDVIKAKNRGIEKETLTKIMLTLLEKKPTIYEGSIETDSGIIEYYLKEYSNNFTTFYISANNKTIIKFTGNKQIAWKLIEKIRDISMRATQKSYQNSKQQYAAVMQTHVNFGIGDAQLNRTRAENSLNSRGTPNKRA